MSGHNKWSKIKHKKEASDQQKGKVFSKYSRLISIMARKGADPEKNIELKNIIEQAKSENMPNDSIERAIKRANEKEMAQLIEVKIEAMGPEGSAFIIEAITDNSNRTINEVKNILKKADFKMVQPNSLGWMFRVENGELVPNLPILLSAGSLAKIDNFLNDLSDHDDIKEIYTNIQNENIGN